MDIETDPRELAIYLNENVLIWIKISLKFASKVQLTIFQL